MTSPIVGETVTLIKRSVTGQDALGNDVEGEVTVPFDGAVFAPGGSTENIQGMDQVIETPRFIWIGVVPDLTAVDAIRRPNGDTYEIDGKPGDYISPFDGQQVLEVHVRKVGG